MPNTLGKRRNAPKIDLAGKRFGRWAVTTYVRKGKWSCVCDCGARAVVRGACLRRGKSKSCGCLKRELCRISRIDLAGKRFGRWSVVAYAKDGKWSCVCECDTRAVVRGSQLRGGKSKSCGCLKRELTKVRATKHGMSGTPEYSSWRAMMERCYNPRHPHYENYGGRGIVVRKDWHSILSWFADNAPPLRDALSTA
jgi:hypothetical protein